MRAHPTEHRKLPLLKSPGSELVLVTECFSPFQVNWQRGLCVLSCLLSEPLCFLMPSFQRILSLFGYSQWMLRQILATKPTERPPRPGNGDSLLNYLVLAGLCSEPPHPTLAQVLTPGWFGILFLGSSYFNQAVGLSITLITGSAIRSNSSKCHCWHIKGKCEISPRKWYQQNKNQQPKIKKATQTHCMLPNKYTLKVMPFFFTLFIDFNVLLLSGLSLGGGTDDLESLKRT